METGSYWANQYCTYFSGNETIIYCHTRHYAFRVPTVEWLLITSGVFKAGKQPETLFTFSSWWKHKPEHHQRQVLTSRLLVRSHRPLILGPTIGPAPTTATTVMAAPRGTALMAQPEVWGSKWAMAAVRPIMRPVPLQSDVTGCTAPARVGHRNDPRWQSGLLALSFLSQAKANLW